MEWPALIVFAIVVALVLRAYVIQTFWIPSGSMEGTLKPHDRVIVNKLAYKIHDIHRGDLIVFRRPPNLVLHEEDLIKRVIAVGGDTVSGHDEAVYVNGQRQEERYTDKEDCGVDMAGNGMTEDFAAITIPKGDLWVMGDNRCGSTDSRVFGPIKATLVVGHAFVLIWPPDRLNWF